VLALCAGAGCAREPTPEAPLTGPAPPTDTSAPPASPSISVQTGLATYYATRFTGMRTANGERYDPRQMTAAHRTLPFGTWIEVRRTTGAAQRAVVVRINDRGPYGRDRIVDLSRRAAEQLGILVDGKVAVELRVVAPPTTSPH